jgi:pyruvate kinase
VVDLLKAKSIVQKGDIVVNTGTMPLMRKHRTNMLKITVID